MVWRLALVSRVDAIPPPFTARIRPTSPPRLRPGGDPPGGQARTILHAKVLASFLLFLGRLSDARCGSRIDAQKMGGDRLSGEQTASGSDPCRLGASRRCPRDALG